MTRRLLTSRERCRDCGVFHVTRREERRIATLRAAQERVKREYEEKLNAR